MRADNPKFSVYTLECPIDKVVRYVGVSQNLPSRYRSHLCSHAPVGEWIKDLRKQNLLPIMNEVKSGLTRLRAQKFEKELILAIHKEHGSLLNRLHVTRKLTVPIINYLPKIEQDQD